MSKLSSTPWLPTHKWSGCCWSSRAHKHTFLHWDNLLISPWCNYRHFISSWREITIFRAGQWNYFSTITFYQYQKMIRLMCWSRAFVRFAKRYRCTFFISVLTSQQMWSNRIFVQLSSLPDNCISIQSLLMITAVTLALDLMVTE